MTTAESNMTYLGLTVSQYGQYQELMRCPMSSWPGSLRDYCREQSRREGVCGDLLASWVAEWIRQGKL